MEVPSQRHFGDHCFQGAANVVYQSLELIERHRADMVAVFDADHVYRMDVRQMMEFHCAHDADITFAARRSAEASWGSRSCPEGIVRSCGRTEEPASWHFGQARAPLRRRGRESIEAATTHRFEEFFE